MFAARRSCSKFSSMSCGLVGKRQFSSPQQQDPNTALLKNFVTYIALGGGLLGIGLGVKSVFFSEEGQPSNAVVETRDDHDPQGPVTEKVYMDISVNGREPKRLIIGKIKHGMSADVKNLN